MAPQLQSIDLSIVASQEISARGTFDVIKRFSTSLTACTTCTLQSPRYVLTILLCVLCHAPKLQHATLVGTGIYGQGIGSLKGKAAEMLLFGTCVDTILYYSSDALIQGQPWCVQSHQLQSLCVSNFVVSSTFVRWLGQMFRGRWDTLHTLDLHNCEMLSSSEVTSLFKTYFIDCSILITT